MEDKLLYKDLTYIVRGILFETHNELGRMLKEKQYCDLIEVKLKERKIRHLRESVLPPSFEGEHKGRNRVDFIIEGKKILEIKTVSFLSKNDYWQCQRYLSSTNLELLLLVNFRSKFLTVKRLLNHELYNKNKIN